MFALSLRQPKLSEDVNKQISEVYFNIDKALERLAENQVYQGVSNQQFAITATNNLADMLSDILDNMQESMSMSMGQGGQGDMQLPDIIMTQEQLNQMMQQGLKQGKKGKPKEGEGNKKGNSEKEGQDGENGEKGNKGEQGKQSGQHGNEGNKGENGQKLGGEGQGDGFYNEALLYEIYQKQQQLREALDNRLKKEGKGGIGSSLSKQMEEIELELLNKGFTNQTLQKMMNLKHQLLKMENATFQQGEDNKRASETNKKQFDNNANNQTIRAKQYFQTTEILNRQALPLQQIYKKKVQQYFKNSND
ncbi:liver stage antigen putative [Jejuia pallidilutea]|uniref:Liver stage antigen putative n=1 Tax=Jejuia pallidilutea TaxID=504487 RepID=A0A090VPR8_9FLAO|nr:liver stage antigen putative [Jejuia pallidilutea]